jgi:purine-binding chemotaxis protein CheW
MSDQELATAENSPVEVQKYMEFSLGDETFAIPLLMVKEVINIPEFTPVPYTPSYFLGIMNLRGQVLSAIDLRKKMSITPNIEHNETAIIILDLDNISLGIMVDSINSVLSIEKDSLSSPPDLDSKVGSEFILGVHRKEDGLSLIVDIKNLLSSKDIKIISSQAKAS